MTINRQSITDRWLWQTAAGPILKHPLVQDLAWSQSLATSEGKALTGEERFRESLAWKTQALQRAYERRDWASWIGIHERYARPEALFGIMEDDDIELDEWLGLVLEVWDDHEYASQNDLWLEIFDRIPDKRLLMSKNDLRHLDQLPDPVTVWRGLAVEPDLIDEIDFGHNWSWSLDREKAEWFSNRHARARRIPVLIEADIPSEHWIAYHSGRSESELICQPDVLGYVGFGLIRAELGDQARVLPSTLKEACYA